MKKQKPRLYKHAKDCSGCAVCAAICPVEAITFEYDSEGFLYPKINKNTCIECMKCEKVCAYKKDILNPIGERKHTHIYAAKVKDSNTLFSSSSGGMFSVLSDLFFERNDSVVSCVYSYEKNAVCFSFLEDQSIRNEARGSKYIQAETGNTFREIIRWLSRNSKNNMLVVGTGCQIAGLDLLLKEKRLRDRVVLVDLICHGAASPGLWKNFLCKVEKENGGKIHYLTFKNKRNGWENPSVFVKIKDKEVSIKSYADWFYMGWTLRKSCYQCPYTRIDRHSDLTIGDFWGIQNVMPDFYDKMGVSLVITHSPKGEKIFQKITKSIEYCESNRIDCLQPRLKVPPICPKNREKFWQDMKKKGLDYCEKRYFENYNIPMSQKIKNLMKKVIFVFHSD